MAQAWFRVACPRWLRLVLRPVLSHWRPPVLLPVFPRRHQAAVSARDRPRDRPTAQAWFRVPCPQWLRLVLRPVLRPWRPPVLLSVFPRRVRAAVPARDRPLDRPMAQAWFRVPCPRWLRLVLRLVLRPWALQCSFLCSHGETKLTEIWSLPFFEKCTPKCTLFYPFPITGLKCRYIVLINAI